MAKPEWGTKRLCQSCGAKFYDMGRDPIVCLKCGTVFEPQVKQRRTRTPRAEAAVAAAPAAAKKPEVAEEDEELVVEGVDDIEDDDNLDDVGIGSGASEEEEDT